MPWLDDPEFSGVLGLPQGLNVSPEVGKPKGSVIASAFRLENPVVSALSSFRTHPIWGTENPEYRPWESLQGTEYEDHASRFVGARDEADVAAMKAQIDREEADKAVLHAAGWKGTVSAIAASVLSPTNLLPAGSIVVGAKGVSIARTALNVGAAAAGSAAIDETVLQATQVTRTKEESMMAIGGSAILGGFLGAAVGKMAGREFVAASKSVERALQTRQEFDQVYRSLSAAAVLPADLKVRGEEFFQAVRKIPGLEVFVKTDPVIRMQLSELDASRAGLSELANTPLEWRANREGVVVGGPDGSVEARILDRERTDLVESISSLHDAYARYWKDGPVGFVGQFTAPITARFSHLTGMTEKLTQSQFLDEVGKAMRRGDKHPIAQVQEAADALRSRIFDRVKQDMVDLGIWDDSLQVSGAESYLTRVYNQGLIRDDREGFAKMLVAEFKKKRDAASNRLLHDDTVDQHERHVLRLKETIAQSRKSLRKAAAKAAQKAERAQVASAKGEGAGKALGRLRAAFAQRVADLTDGLLPPDAREIFKSAIHDARGAERLRPMSLLEAVRAKGGIRDPRAGGMWNGKGWGKGAAPTDLEMILDTKARTIRRDDGLELDHMREALVESGYLPEGATIADMYEAIAREANGERVFSSHDEVEREAWEAAMRVRDDLAEMGVDISDPIDKIIAKVHGPANAKTAKVKAKEAGRAAKAAEDAEAVARKKVVDALDRYEAATGRLRQIDEEIGPKVRAEIKAAQKEMDDTRKELLKAKSARSKDEFYASATDAEVEAHVDDTIMSILGLKEGEHHAVHAFAKPTRARVLDVDDEMLEPWLESNVETIMRAYHHSMVPQIEMIRQFGDLEGKRVLTAMHDEAAGKIAAATTAKARARIERELKANARDFAAMRDRLLGRYGAPDDPRSVWIQGGRTARQLSYMGYLGGMTLSAIPDVANTFGRSVAGALGTMTSAMMEPSRLFSSAKEMAEYGASADWWLNSRMTGMSDALSRGGNGSRLERAMAEGSRKFSIATGMIPWNVGWKSIGGAGVSSQMLKAADAVRAGKASEKQKRILAANGIEPWMAERIAGQMDKFGDREGITWLARGADWDDAEALKAFRRAMNREFDMMVVTPGQDKPLAFSTEAGKFFFQFKSFGFSAYHRVLLAGLQRADADTVAQFTMALLLGGLVSNIKADLGGYDRKTGSDFWVDALDRSGLSGWIMEPYGVISATFPQLSIGAEAPSRFQGRSRAAGALGPSVDMGLGMVEAMSAMSRGQASYRDVRKMMRPLPGNNHPLLNGPYMFNLYSRLEDALVNATGAKPRN